MANQKLTALTENESPALVDLVYSVDDPSVTPLSRKVTLQNVMELAPYYMDRGDIATSDYWTGDLTQDGTWRDLDLSSIVPAGTIAVKLRVSITHSVYNFIRFRENGNSNVINVLMCAAIVANISNEYQGIINCDVNRVIEYYGNATADAVYVRVVGWVIDTVN